MTKPRMHRTALSSALIVLTTLGLTLSAIGPTAATPLGAPLGAPKPQVVQFALPTKGASPIGIAAGETGAWFAENAADAMGFVSFDGTISEYPLPGKASLAPWDVTIGPAGNVWFTENDAFAGGVSGVGELAPDGTLIASYSTPTSGAGPDGITVDTNGNIWFTERTASALAVLIDGTVVEHPLGKAVAPSGIASGPDADLWFTESAADRIGVADTTGTVVHEYALPAGSAPDSLAVGPDSAMWFTEPGSGAIGRIDPTTGKYSQFTAGTSKSGLASIATGADGRIWFVETAGNALGKLDPSSGAVSTYKIPVSKAQPTGLVTGSDGNAWITERTAGAIGRLDPATASVKQAFGPPGAVMKLSGAGFGAGQAIQLMFDDQQIGTTKSTAQGAISASGHVPTSATPGVHTLIATQFNNLSASVAFQVRVEWAQYGFDASNDRFNPYENVINASNVSQLTQDWSADLGDFGNTPTVVDDNAYVTAGPSVMKFGPTGDLLWTYHPPGYSASSPVVSGGVVYVSLVSCCDGLPYLIALDDATGAQEPYSPLQLAAPCSSEGPTIVGHTLFVTCDDNTVKAIDITGGLRQLWSSPIPGAHGNTTDGYGYGTPAVASGLVVVGGSGIDTDGSISAFHVADGSPAWTVDTHQPVWASPAVSNGVVFAGTADQDHTTGTLYAVYLQTGRVKWTVSEGPLFPSVAVASGVVYAADTTSLHAVSAANGAELWRQAIVGGTDASDANDGPAVADGVVYVCEWTASAVQAFDAAHGTPLWSHTFGGNWTQSSPVVADGVLYVSGNLSLYAFVLGG